jgi:uncharacterized protein YkwD
MEVARYMGRTKGARLEHYRIRQRLGLVVVVTAALMGAVAARPMRASADTVSMEDQLLALINGGRGAALASHSGLRVAGRSHSRDMAAAGQWNHDGAAERIHNAQPDPYETNGPPDDGFTGTWCENVDQEWGGTADTIAQRIYDRWHASAEHLQCMTNPQMTVAGVGIYFDGTNYWATLELARDLTPPGEAPIARSTTIRLPASNPTAQPGPSVQPRHSPRTSAARPSTRRPLAAPGSATVSVETPSPSVAPIVAAAPPADLPRAAKSTLPFAIATPCAVVALLLVRLRARRA